MARLFVAVWPPDDVVAALRSLPGRDGGRWVPEQNWHVTLRFLGDGDADEVAATLRGARLPRATAQLGPRVQRFAGRMLAVPVHGLDELADAVIAATDGLAPPERRRFRGHITLARRIDGVTSAALGTPVDAAFPVADVALVASELDGRGPTYTTLATFPTSPA